MLIGLIMDGSTIPSAPSMKASTIIPSSSFLALALGLRPMLKRYESLPQTETPWDFANIVLQSFGTFLINEGESLEETIPATGPLIVYANHAFGGIEGLIMAARCGAIRPDFKLIANRMLYRIPELRSMIIPINVSAKSQKENFSAVRMALRHVERGGAVGIFPSGVVTHFNLAKMALMEPSWFSLSGRLARIPNAQVVPMYFKGTNSALFHALGCIHPLLRTIRLPRELWSMRGRTIRYVVGKPIDKKLLQDLSNDEARTAHMRVRCEQLGQVDNSLPKIWHTPVAKACDNNKLLAEVKKFLSKTLVVDGRYTIFSFEGRESSFLLDELCRLREKTFRLVGEGSGEDRDSDKFDIDYTHLVLWDTENEAIAGAYRVRCFDASEASNIANKLYTASLFTYKSEFFEYCKSSMELGRAFVTPEYQRDYEPLMLLWKGIARLTYLKKIRTLFGPCSMGLGYAEASAFMLRQFLMQNHWHEVLASFTSGKRDPAAFSGVNVPNVEGLDYKGCNRAVKDVEGDKGLPILFKHYLQLGGRIAAFHEDRVFGTLDALLVVDLAESPEKVLLRYMSMDELQELRQSYVE